MDCQCFSSSVKVVIVLEPKNKNLHHRHDEKERIEMIIIDSTDLSESKKGRNIRDIEIGEEREILVDDLQSGSGDIQNNKASTSACCR